jgi:hypothetical protein
LFIGSKLCGTLRCFYHDGWQDTTVKRTSTV